jgi:hypothetical protein
MTRTTIAVGGIATVGAAALLMFSHEVVIRERERNRELRRQVEDLTQRHAERSSPGPLSMPASVKSSLPGEQWRQLMRLRGEYGALRGERAEAVRLQADNSRLHSNWVHQLAGGKKLTLAQVEPYLNANQRNAQSLVAASRLTGELDLLREAVEKHPADPRVQFAAYFAFREDTRPDDQRKRLEAFKESAPDNALANYLAAQEHFKRGRREEAVLELVVAADKPRFQDYYGEFVQDAQAAYESVGLSSLEAAELSHGQPLPHLAELRGLGESLAELARTYWQSGDEASAMAALQMGVALGRQLVEPSGHSPIIGEFVGIAIEKQLLETLDPASPYDTSGRTVHDRLDALIREREARKELWKQAEPRLRALPDADRALYYEWMRAAGELAAWHWLVSLPGPE